MDQSTLVADEVKEGRRLIEQLVRAGHPVRAAFWARLTEDDYRYLYIVTDHYDQIGPLGTYREIEDSIAALQPTWLKLSGIKALSPHDRLAVSVMELTQSISQMNPWNVPGMAERTGIEQAYFYPVSLFHSAQPAATP